MIHNILEAIHSHTEVTKHVFFYGGRAVEGRGGGERGLLVYLGGWFEEDQQFFLLMLLTRFLILMKGPTNFLA